MSYIRKFWRWLAPTKFAAVIMGLVLVYILACGLIAVVCATSGCAYEPPVIGEEYWKDKQDASDSSADAVNETPPSSEHPSQDASIEASIDASVVVDAGHSSGQDASLDATVDAAPDASVVVDAGHDSGLAVDGSGLFRLVVQPGGGAHTFTVYFNSLSGRTGEPTWGNPVYTQTSVTAFDQSVKAFPGSTFIAQGYWDPAYAGDWTRQMCNPSSLTLAVTVHAAFQGSHVPITVVSNGQGGCNLKFTMPLMN